MRAYIRVCARARASTRASCNQSRLTWSSTRQRSSSCMHDTRVIRTGLEVMQSIETHLELDKAAIKLSLRHHAARVAIERV